MSDKYIIRNCPVNYGLYKEMCGFTEQPEDIGKTCADCTDCVMKKIVEKCREHHNDLHFTPSEVLSLIDIEECE